MWPVGRDDTSVLDVIGARSKDVKSGEVGGVRVELGLTVLLSVETSTILQVHWKLYSGIPLLSSVKSCSARQVQ